MKKSFRVTEVQNIDGIILFRLQHKNRHYLCFSGLKHNAPLYDALDKNREICLKVNKGLIEEVL